MVIIEDIVMGGTGHSFLPSILPSILVNCFKIYSPSDLFLIHGSFLHGRQHIVIDGCSVEVAPCMIDLNVSPGDKSHLSLYMIIRERLQGSSSSIR